MRIAVLSPFVDKQHGTERVLAEVLERLAAVHQVEIHLYAQRVEGLKIEPRSFAGDGLPADVIQWHRVSSAPGPHLLRYVWWYFANGWLRRRDERSERLRPELIYSAGINSSDADAVTVHIVFHAFYEEVREELRLFRIAPQYWPRIIHRKLYYQLIMALERRIYSDRRVALTAVSRLVADQLHKFFGRSDVVVARNGVDRRQFNSTSRLSRREEARARFGISSATFVFLLIGNDWKKKGLGALLEAVAACEDLPIVLLVVGRDEREPFAKTCEKLRIVSKVRFILPSPDVMQFYSVADAYIGPSLEDAYGLPILEAMACGLPVIASKNAGASEIIEEGKSGLLLNDPRDSHTLAERMRALTRDPELVASLGGAAEQAADGESWDALATKMYDHLEQVAARIRETRH